MSDDGNIPEEQDDDEVGHNLTIDMGDTPPVYVLEGQNYSVLFANPGHTFHPFFWLKDCIGCTVYAKPGSQAPDEVKFLIKVGDGIEERSLSEVYHHESEKVYEPSPRLKRVH